MNFDVLEGASMDDIIKALNGTSFSVESKNSSYFPMSVTSFSFGDGEYTEQILAATSFTEMHQCRFSANENGLILTNKLMARDGVEVFKTWNELGIDDITQAAGKTINFSDSKTGISFTAKIKDDATEEEIYKSFGWSIFSFKYSNNPENRMGSSITMYGYNISNETITEQYSTARLTGLTKFEFYGDKFFDMFGYSYQERMSSKSFSITLLADDDGKPMARVTDKANNNFVDLHWNCIDPGSFDRTTHGRVIFGNNPGEHLKLTFDVAKSYSENIRINTPEYEEFLGYLGTLGIVTTNVDIQPYIVPSLSLANITRTTKEIGRLVPGDIEENANESVTVQNHKEFWVQSGTESGDGILLKFGNMNSSILGINGLTVSEEEQARKSLSKVSKGLHVLSSIRSDIGAQQNRLEHTIKHQENTIENTQKAESQIRDTDMAEEMMKLSAQNVIQQAGVAMLSQVNQSNQSVLDLLK